SGASEGIRLAVTHAVAGRRQEPLRVAITTVEPRAVPEAIAVHERRGEVAVRCLPVDGEARLDMAAMETARRDLPLHCGAAGGYCLWLSTSVNLESAFESAQRALGPVDRVSTQLKPYPDARSVLARRHYIATGTLRHFEVRYAEPAALLEAAVRPTDADGLIVVTLCESPDECRAAVANATAMEVVSRPEVIIAVPPP